MKAQKHLKSYLWPISKNHLSACNYIFLDLNLVGNTKKHERIQNFHILWKMYRESWPLEANFRQKRICKKNVRPQFGQNQKFLIYKLFRLIFVTSCIEGIFDFSKIEARFVFYRKKTFSASLFTRSNKTCNILGTTCQLLLF